MDWNNITGCVLLQRRLWRYVPWCLLGNSGRTISRTSNAFANSLRDHRTTCRRDVGTCDGLRVHSNHPLRCWHGLFTAVVDDISRIVQQLHAGFASDILVFDYCRTLNSTYVVGISERIQVYCMHFKIRFI